MQGFNMGRYIPPAALDSGLTSANAAAGKPHALGNRASKLKTQGILTVRFEMPFAIWCSSCPKPIIIGQGVRFNAEKKKVGNYHTTPIWAFRMKHTACGGWIEIRTDPKNTEYVVHEGGKRRDYGTEEKDDDGKRVGGLGEILTEEEREKRRNDAFAAFEGKKHEKETGRVEAQRVEEVYADRDQQWSDPYSMNQKLRRGFRAERKIRQRLQREKEAIQDRMGLGIELLDEIEADRRAASLIDFGEVPSAEQEDDVQKISSRSMFEALSRPVAKGHAGTKTMAGRPRTKNAIKGSSSKGSLQHELKDNTRAIIDPFNPHSATFGLTRNYSIAGLKKKVADPPNGDDVNSDEFEPPVSQPGQNFAPALVDYDSDE